MEDDAFGLHLKRLREQRGFSVNQLAMYSGVSNAQISRMENGQRGIPKPETIDKLAKGLKIPYEELMRAAGHIDGEHNIPDFFTPKDKRDLKKFLNEEKEIMFDGVPLSEEDKEKVSRVMEAMFMDAKKQNKHKKKNDTGE